MNHLTCIISNHVYIIYCWQVGQIACTKCESDWLISIFIKISTYID